MASDRKTPLTARVLIFAVVLAGAAIVTARVPDVLDWGRSDLLTFLALVATVAIAQQFTIPIRHGEETENLDTTDAVWAGALLLAEPSVITLAVAAGILAGQAARGWSGHKIAFNVGQDVVAITAALLVYGALRSSAEEPQSWLAAGLGMGAYLVVNSSLVSLVISLVERKPYRTVLLPSAGLTLLQWSANVAFGVLVAVVILAAPAALPLLGVPLLLFYLTYRGWLRGVRERELMREMARTADSISEQGDLGRRVTDGGADDVGQLAATLNRMLDRLDAAFRRERRFMSEVSHELRTPITICRGHLEVMASRTDSDEVRDGVALAVDELERMGRLVDDMVTLARADSDRFLRRETIALDRFLADLGAKAVQLLDGRLSIVPAKAGATLEGDPQRLTQALINLLQNAAVHAHNGCPVVLRVAEEARGWRFEVEDEGGGIALEPAESIFQPFSRGRTQAPGSGLGLAIVRTIAEAHGGAAGVVNRPGEGATFWIRLPR
jgi:signal transduction histidine kinase